MHKNSHLTSESCNYREVEAAMDYRVTVTQFSLYKGNYILNLRMMYSIYDLPASIRRIKLNIFILILSLVL